MLAFFNRHASRRLQLGLPALGIVLALVNGCDTLLSIDEPTLVAAVMVEPDAGTNPGPPGPRPRPDDGGATMTCSDDGSEMECCPDCTDATCGSDGCGGMCGECDKGAVCTKDRTCTCLPDCKDKVCGSDGCGGMCGTCSMGTECSEDGKDCSCVPQCGDHVCGPDGCGGSCGDCEADLICDTRIGTCVPECVPNCDRRVCGSDGCGEGSCGECEAGESCNAMGRCECMPNCVGRACGSNGCSPDVSCGECEGGQVCDDGQCACEPKTECEAGECGGIDDGCGGTVECDACPDGQVCRLSECCTPAVCGDECGSISDGCGGRINCDCASGFMCNSAHACVAVTPPPMCTGASQVEFCDELPKLAAAPTIDGISDCGSPLQTITPVGWTESVGAIPPGVAARYRAAWFDTGLYVYVEVDVPSATTADAAPVPNPSALDVPYYCGDSVEIDAVLDGDELGNYYRVPGGGQTVVRAPENGVAGNTAQAYAHTGVMKYADSRTWTDAQTIGSFARAGGYTVEALITGAAVGGWRGSLRAGQRIGFDIGINVAAPPGTPAEQIDGPMEGCSMMGERLGQFYLQTASDRVPDCGSNGDPWCTPSALCNPELR